MWVPASAAVVDGGVASVGRKCGLPGQGGLELVEDDLELVLSEGRFHVPNAVYVGHPGNMVKKG